MDRLFFAFVSVALVVGLRDRRVELLGFDRPRRQLEDFANAIRTGSAPRVSGEDALSSVQVIEAAYRSLAEGRWQRVEGAAP